MRRMLLLALVTLLLPFALAAATSNRGTYFPEDNPNCNWTCSSGSTGSINAGSLTACRNACATACHATCQILF